MIDLLAIQRDLAIALQRAGNFQECLENVLQSAMRLPCFELGAIYRCGPGGRGKKASEFGLQLAAYDGLPAERMAPASRYGVDSQVARAARAGRIIDSASDELPPELKELLTTEKLTQLMLVPMRRHRDVVAALVLCSRTHPQIHPESRTAIESMAILAASNFELLELREARQLADRQLRLAIEAADLGFWLGDLDTGMVEATPRFRELHGLPPDLALNPEIMRSTALPDHAPRIDEMLDEATHDQSAFATEYQTRDGARWIALCGRYFGGNRRQLCGVVRDITAEKRLQAELRNTRQALAKAKRNRQPSAPPDDNYRRLHESMREAFIKVDMTGRIIESNTAFEELTGYAAAELRQMTYMDLTPEPWHAVDVHVLHEQILPRGYSNLYEKEYLRKDGTLIPIEVHAFLIRDAAGEPESIWGIIRDITGRHASEDVNRNRNQALEHRLAERVHQLQQSESRFRQLAEATFEAIVVSENGIIIDGNPQLGTLLGHDVDDLVGRPLTDFIAPEFRDPVATPDQAEISRTYEGTGTRSDGTQFPLEAKTRIRIWDQRAVRITALRDLTETKLAAARLQRQQGELEQARRLALVSEVSAGIIHQISQPISSVDTNLATLSTCIPNGRLHSAECLEVLDELRADIARVRQVITHLRSLSNPEQPDRVPIDFNQLVRDILPLLERAATNRQTRLSVRIAPKLPTLLGDPIQLQQVILNLCSNAFDACNSRPQGKREVSLTAQLQPGFLLITVRDTGTGIDDDAADRLFSLFFTTKPNGLGVGLRLCRTIIEAHQGSIEGYNHPDGNGAVFNVKLPV